MLFKDRGAFFYRKQLKSTFLHNPNRVVSQKGVDKIIAQSSEGEKMGELVRVGSFCPYKSYRDYGQMGKGNLVQYGKSRQGQQRYQCKTCKRTFNERRGTLFYNRKTAAKDIVECLALLAEGVRISSISRSKGIKEDTLLAWLRQAAVHAEQVEAVLLNNYHIKQAQIDGLWTYVGRKAEKTSDKQPMKQANTGAVG